MLRLAVEKFLLLTLGKMVSLIWRKETDDLYIQRSGEAVERDSVIGICQCRAKYLSGVRKRALD